MNYNQLSKRIACKNRKKEIVDYIIVSNEDYENVIKYNWYISIEKQKNKDYKRVKGRVNGKQMQLNHFIAGIPKYPDVVDHINNNSLDNRRENLHITTRSHNGQNKEKKENTSSKYIGVCFKKSENKWEAYSCSIYLGLFENELDAAIIYDKYTLIKFGKNASTNNLVKYEEISNLTLEDIKPSKNRALPRNIKKSYNLYHAIIIYKKKEYRSKAYEDINIAIKCLDEFKLIINKLKDKEKEAHLDKEILRDNEGNAIINLYDTNKNITGSSIVDDDLWHSLSQFSWYLSEGYAMTSINKTNISMHRHILGPDKDLYVDHKDNNPLNNKKSNLRLATSAENSYNKEKSKTTANNYKGVYYTSSKKYSARITKEGCTYSLGSYINEIQAAIAYNMKAVELFGEFANLNKIDIDTDLYAVYKTEILNYKNIQKGVTKTKNNTYSSTIYIDKKGIYLGTYDTEVKALIAYNVMSIELKGSSAFQNEINIDEETYEILKTEIINKWNKKKN